MVNDMNQIQTNCCEWKDNGLYGYSTSCTEFRSKIAYKDTFFEYCPYCGKKIKVVEQMERLTVKWTDKQLAYMSEQIAKELKKESD